MPQAVRAFAAERLAESGEDHAARRAHAEHLADVASSCREWKGATPAAQAWLSARGHEVRPALAWVRAREPLLHIRLIAAVGSWLLHTGRANEAFAEVTAALDAAGDARGPDVGYAKMIAAYHLLVHGRESEAPALIDAGLAELRAAGHEPLLGYGLRLAAIVYQYDSIPGPHRELADEAVAISRRLGEPYRLAFDLLSRSQSNWIEGDFDAAQRDLYEAESLVDPEDYDLHGITTARADAALARGDWYAAAAAYARSAAAELRAQNLGQCFFDLSGEVAALAKLGRHAAVLEIETLRLELSAESGERAETMPRLDYHGIMAGARTALTPAESDAAAARMRDLPRHARADRIIELGDAVSGAPATR
jgi:hypothetical protein